MRLTLLSFLFSCLLATQALASLAPFSVDDLTQSSDLIVIAKVESLSKPVKGQRYARAKVTEVLKGTHTKTVKFLASRTWTCDISEAKKGETVLLFLTMNKKLGSYVINCAGRGRMPLRTVDGKSYATFWPDVGFPKDTPTIAGPAEQWNFLRSVEVTTLRELVKKAPPKKDSTE